MRPVRAAVAVVGMAVLAGCDVPTSIPKLDQSWILPAENTSISVDGLLPSGVTVSGSSFAVQVDPFSAAESLGTLCPSCVNGVTGPVPAFDGTFNAQQSLPTSVTGATVASGSIQVSIHNGFSFDPIAGGGSLTITLQDGNGGSQIGQVVIDGATETLPPGSTVTRTMSVAPGAIGSVLFASTDLNCQGGQIATVHNSDQISVTATPSNLTVSSADVDVSNRTVQISPVSLDVADVDQTITDHIVSGSVDLDITNPFGVAFTGQLVINGVNGPISKPLNVSNSGASTARIDYSKDEFQQFLGHDNVSFAGTAVVAANAGVITVTPGEQADMKAKINLTLEIGG